MRYEVLWGAGISTPEYLAGLSSSWDLEGSEQEKQSAGDVLASESVFGKQVLL